MEVEVLEAGVLVAAMVVAKATPEVLEEKGEG